MRNSPTSFEETEAFLYKLRNAGSKYSLDRMRRIMAALGNPQEKYPTIHIAGTNGKGSTAAMVESILRNSGLKTGMFTSPHLVYLGERVQVDRVPVSKGRLLALVKRIRDIVDAEFNPSDTENYPSFFEYMTALAFLDFFESRVDCAVIEVGLGGRLDSTNILTRPELCAITSIGFDHTQLLGDTYEKIASEKAGIIKSEVPVLCGWLPDEAMRTVENVAGQRNSKVYKIPEIFYGKGLPRTSLYGEFQRRNAAMAFVAARLLKERAESSAAPKIFSGITEKIIRRGLLSVNWDARWQTVPIPGGKKIILDASHNEECARVLDSNLSSFCASNPKPAIALGVLGIERAKPILDVVKKYASKIFLLEPKEPRALSAKELRGIIGFCDIPIEDSTVEELFGYGCRSLINSEFKTLVCTGSIYLCGEILALIKGKISDGLQDRPY